VPRRVKRKLRNIYDLRPEIDERSPRQRANFPEIVEEDFWEAYEIAKPYSMLLVTGFYNIYQSMRYLADNDVPGDFVECGVLFGGSSIFIALLRRALGMEERRLHIFDTFAGPPPGSEDSKGGIRIRGPRYASFFDAVVENLERTSGTENVQFHVGPVEETLNGFEPGPLALARLDTDFYSSTHKELEVLYPLLSEGGVLIVDDYGTFDGSRRATDEFLARVKPRALLLRIDGGIWAGVKPPGSAGASR
jgi:O-methyltransferase